MENKILNTAEPIDYSKETAESKSNEVKEECDNSMNFLIDSGFSVYVEHIEETRHSDEFVQKIVEKGLKDFNYMFPKCVGKNALEFTGVWKHGEIKFVSAEKHGVCVSFSIDGNHHNNYIIPYDVAYKLIPKAV